MKLKTKTIIVGILALICGLVAAYIALFNMLFPEGIVFLAFAFLYVVLRDKYGELRCKEIYEEFKEGRITKC